MSRQFSGFAVAGGLLLLAVGGAVLWQRIDSCPDDLLNRILWTNRKGSKASYPQHYVACDKMTTRQKAKKRKNTRTKNDTFG